MSFFFNEALWSEFPKFVQILRGIFFNELFSFPKHQKKTFTGIRSHISQAWNEDITINVEARIKVLGVPKMEDH